MLAENINVLDGNTFVVSDRRGDLCASTVTSHGLFHEDMRYLSRLELTVDGQTPQVLSTDDVAYHSAQFFLVQPSESLYEDTRISIIRRRSIDHGFTDTVTILNHGQDPAALALRFDIEADFADLFEIKDQLSKSGELYRQVRADTLVFGYRRDSFVRETRITTSRDDAVFTDDGLQFELDIEPRGEWRVELRVLIAVDIHWTLTDRNDGAVAEDDASRRNGLDGWLRRAPKVRSSWSTIEDTYRQSMTDLAALRLPAYANSGAVVPAAGLPWFMCMFGRDSIITSYQTLPFIPDFSRSTLRLLALLQAQNVDDFRDAEPGKILHELRSGELTAFEERPHSPYFGAADSTPLFLVLLDEYERWTGDEALVHELEQPARAALDWIDTYGDLDDDGYVEYQRRNTETGLENQCWKDSHNSIVFADGTNSRAPRATCEIQGYVYDAKHRVARLARQFWGDEALADRLETEARSLRVRFNRDFWMPERECFALALDGDKRQVDSITSNIGHLLWSGIADDDKAHACARHLLDPALFSGWGIRTMASTEAAYNPVGYHTGTVWPHDNSLAAHGLARYGHHDEAALVALGVLQAGTYFRHRLPEAFAGYSRDVTQFPVEFPTACSPQAWAAGTPLLFLRTLLGLEPRGFRLHIDPALPPEIDYIDITGICGRWGRTSARSRDATVASSIAPEPGSIDDVLDTLAAHVDEERLAALAGSLRIDIVGGTNWHLSVSNGRLLVTRSGMSADCVLKVRGDDLLDIYQGTKTPNVVAMQGNLEIDGDLSLALSWGTVFAAAGNHARTS